MLSRFIQAQNQYPYANILQELKNGRKTGHWIWYVFPQMKGMGSSYNSKYFGLEDLAEAREYWADTVLGGRLRECLKTLLGHAPLNIQTILCSNIDGLKLNSCLTLFQLAAPEEPLFQEVLDTFYSGSKCKHTLQQLKGGQ
jgi:uncharacterized protein (DUF1810 family)